MAPGRGADEIKAHLSELNRDVIIIFVCDRYKDLSMLGQGFSLAAIGVLLGACAARFLEGAKAWPELASWMHTWVEAIGELYYLNAERLAVWNQELSLAEQSEAFQSRHRLLADGLTAMATKRDSALADPDLPGAKKKVLSSLKKSLVRIDGVSGSSPDTDGYNKAENSARNPATGRKNYYGSGAEWSAELAAMLFSVLTDYYPLEYQSPALVNRLSGGMRRKWRQAAD